MYERRGQPLLDRRSFVRRLTRHMLLAAAVLLVALGIGILGYRLVAGLSWVDAVMNAAMILGEENGSLDIRCFTKRFDLTGEQR